MTKVDATMIITRCFHLIKRESSTLWAYAKLILSLLSSVTYPLNTKGILNPYKKFSNLTLSFNDDSNRARRARINSHIIACSSRINTRTSKPCHITQRRDSPRYTRYIGLAHDINFIIDTRFPSTALAVTPVVFPQNYATSWELPRISSTFHWIRKSHNSTPPSLDLSQQFATIYKREKLQRFPPLLQKPYYLWKTTSLFCHTSKAFIISFANPFLLRSPSSLLTHIARPYHHLDRSSRN